ncbi:MAG: UDP-galactopyranose mutase [Prevotella sp.]|nr:UDP-galactopyranose mutase [Prevotella sp.]MBR1449894.1 UDP-galactopyranose mutase [Prevotella sp.]
MTKRYDYLIVGAGLFGCMFAYRAKQAGRTCLVIDRRPHLGGNIYTERIEGINVHKYGAHIFHTSSPQVWQFVNSLVEFNRYTNSPIAVFGDKHYNLPFNMNTFYQMWGVLTPADAQRIIDEQRREVADRLRREGVSEPRNLEEQALMLVGRDIYETLIKGYTEKQWGRQCTDLPAFIIKRLPLRFVHDNNYFNDKYQGIPVGGYSLFIDKLLQGIETRTSADFFEDRAYWEGLADTVVFTGQVDEFFDYRLGRLDYRTLRFEHEVLPVPNYQGNAVMNFTDRQVPYTRIIEHKHFELFGQSVYDLPSTVITREYPAEWEQGLEPFYTVNDDKNNRLAEQYRDLSAHTPHVIFGGRLAEYRYYDMAPIVEKVLNMTIL